MGQNIFRFMLSGPNGTKVISEPEGWAKIKLTLERDKEYHSLVELIETPFMFYGSNGVQDGGMDYLVTTRDVFGVDSQVSILIEISHNRSAYENLFIGLIDMQSLRRIDSRKVEGVITRDDLWARFKNRIDTPVDIMSATSLDGDSITPGIPVTMLLTPQPINKQSLYDGHTGSFNTVDDTYFATFLNITLSGHFVNNGVQTIDGMRILVWQQTDAKENGIYIASSGAWSRSPDANTDAEIETLVFHNNYGTFYSDSNWKQIVNPITIGVTNIIFNTYDYVSDQELFSLSSGFIDDNFEIVTKYSIATTNEGEVREINDSFNPLYSLVDTAPELINVLEIEEEFGELTLNSSIDLKVSFDGYLVILHDDYRSLDRIEFVPTLYIQKNGDTPTVLFFDTLTYTAPVQSFGANILQHDFEVNLNNTNNITDVIAGDLIYVYIKYIFRFYYDEVNPSMDPGDLDVGAQWDYRIFYGGIVDENVSFNFKSLTDASNAQGFFLHDVASYVIDRVAVQNAFYSEYTGSQSTLARIYPEDGCAWNYVLLRGLQIRRYDLTEKPFSISFKQWWDGINPIANLGLSYDYVDGNQVIRVEEKSFFYNDAPILYLDWVNNILESFDKDYIFKKLRFGYKKGQSEDISGLDDYQKQERVTTFKTVGIELVQESEFIAQGIATEVTRRKTRFKSEDYKFDNETFIIWTDPSSPSGVYIPELSDNYNSVSNILYPDERYNLILSPARNLFRWLNFITGCLQKDLTSYLKFVSGEGNFDLITDYSAVAPDYCFAKMGDPLSEKQDIDLSVYGTFLGHLFQPIILEFKHPLSFEQYKQIRDNRTRAIAVSGTDGDHDICFIKKLEYDLINSLGTFTVWKK